MGLYRGGEGKETCVLFCVLFTRGNKSLIMHGVSLPSLTAAKLKCSVNPLKLQDGLVDPKT